MAEGFGSIQAGSWVLAAVQGSHRHRMAEGSDRRNLHRSLHHTRLGSGWELGHPTVLDRPAAGKETLLGLFHAIRWWAVEVREAPHMVRRAAYRLGASTTGVEACRSHRRSTCRDFVVSIPSANNGEELL